VVIRGPRPRTSVSIRGVRDTWDGMEGPICELVFASDPKKSKKLKIPISAAAWSLAPCNPIWIFFIRLIMVKGFKTRASG
jgi:hypothetical protein